jgi:eukaryotic-like serine/threonine-protein kinase
VSFWVSALVGQIFDGYRIDFQRGGGAFGLVFEVTELSTNSRFAMKVLVPGDPQTAAEFDSEGMLLKKLTNCSGVITWVGSGTVTLPASLAGKPVPLTFKYHVMRLASNSLEDLVVHPVLLAALPWSERLTHWRGAIKGVHQMHLNKVMHRDLKSSNCLLMLRGNTVEVQIADLGRSKDVTVAPSVPPIEYAVGRGDPRFAPPEHLWFQGGSSPADFRSADLYGLGSLFVELATGHPMTAQAIGSHLDIHNARVEGAQNYRKGLRRDLAALRPKFHRAIDQIADLPPAIRHEAIQLIKQLCDPVPTEREPKRMLRKRQASDPGLLWLLNRADILSRRLSVETRRRDKSTKATRRSAS